MRRCGDEQIGIGMHGRLYIPRYQWATHCLWLFVIPITAMQERSSKPAGVFNNIEAMSFCQPGKHRENDKSEAPAR